MADPEDDLDAAERALGTEPRTGEDLADRRRRRDWEMRLAPLAELLAPAPPPGSLYGRILERIETEETARALRAERRRAGRWRAAAVAMASAAAVLAVLAFSLPRDPGPELVSVATGEDGAPALVISLNTDEGLATVRPVGIAGPVTGSLELWHIPQGGTPISLGLIDAAEPRQVRVGAAPGDLAAISLEPAGGSLSGQPTGPVLYSGAFVDIR